MSIKTVTPEKRGDALKTMSKGFKAGKAAFAIKTSGPKGGSKKA